MFVSQSYYLSFAVYSLHSHLITVYLSSKCNIFHNDWFTDVSHLIGKVRMKFQQNSRISNEVQSLIELCAIRDGLSNCNILTHADVCHLIE